jgi:hypothetical protein
MSAVISRWSSLRGLVCPFGPLSMSTVMAIVWSYFCPQNYVENSTACLGTPVETSQLLLRLGDALLPRWNLPWPVVVTFLQWSLHLFKSYGDESAIKMKVRRGSFLFFFFFFLNFLNYLSLSRSFVLFVTSWTVFMNDGRMQLTYFLCLIPFVDSLLQIAVLVLLLWMRQRCCFATILSRRVI